MVKPSQRKLMAKAVALKYGFSIRRVCSLFHISETTYHYVSKLNDYNERIAKLLLEITSEHRTWGFQRCYLYIRNVLQLHFSHKRIYRIYCELCLNLRIRPKRRIKRERAEKLAITQFQNHIYQRFRYDFYVE